MPRKELSEYTRDDVDRMTLKEAKALQNRATNEAPPSKGRDESDEEDENPSKKNVKGRLDHMVQIRLGFHISGLERKASTPEGMAAAAEAEKAAAKEKEKKKIERMAAARDKANAKRKDAKDAAAAKDAAKEGGGTRRRGTRRTRRTRSARSTRALTARRR